MDPKISTKSIFNKIYRKTTEEYQNISHKATLRALIYAAETV